MIRLAIERFEPRIRAGTLDVVLRVDEDTNRAIVSFDIRAEMWAQPLPLELYLRSEVNVATGELKLERTA
jgi:type VI secretion system protein ImpF